jgi:hypothetical protein
MSGTDCINLAQDRNHCRVVLEHGNGLLGSI